MNQDFQTISLRNQLLKICPEMENDIQTVSKEDLKELLAMAVQGAEKNDYDHRSNFSGKTSRRDHMIQQLSRLSPDISHQELKALSDADIQDIYIKYKQISESNKKKEMQKKQQNKKRRIIQNGQINIYQMKRVLIDKIPQYRNDIRNLTDDQIKRMYRQLQDKTQMRQNFMRPISPNPATYQSFIPPPPATYHPDPYPMPNSLPILSSIPNIPKLPLRRFEDENQNFFESQANQSQFGIRKRGRPRKIRQSSGFNYDDAPNYGGGSMQNMLKSMGSKPFEYGGEYQPSDYNNLVPKYHQNQSNYPISYDQSDQFRVSKSGSQNFINQFADSSVDYRANEDQSLKLNSKYEKRAKKCKITFYLDSSDLDEEQTQIKVGKKVQRAQDAERVQSNPQKNQQKMIKNNKLTSLIQALKQAFGKQSWKVQ